MKLLSEVLAPATVEVVYRYLVSVMRAAVDDRIITRNPCLRIKLPKIERSIVVPLGIDEVEALAASIDDRYRALVVLAAGTGMRQGECLGLTVDRVDFLRPQIRADRQLVVAAGEAMRFGPPKTSASVRTIPMPQIVADALAAHLAIYEAGPAGLIFTNEAGNAVRRTGFSDLWRSAVKRAGLPIGTRFHNLRHFYASLLIRHGESVKVV